MKKKGLSAVVATLLLVLLAVIAVGIVWGVVNNMVKEGLEEGESCYDLFGKITINKAYTCWDTDELQFSVNREDVDLDSIIVSISTESGTTSFEIPGTYSNAKNYEGSYGEALTLPGKNSGLTYVTNEFSEAPDSITIIPVVDEDQCEAADVLYDIENC